MTLRGGIIAAGEGRRLREDGFAMPKPLVPVAGVPLIESVIRGLRAAGVASLVVIVNEQEQACVDFVRARFPDLDAQFIVRTTASSLESFCAVTSAAGPGRMLVSTVDVWCPPSEFARFVERALARPAEATVLAVTPLVADERPLWVTRGPGGRVTAIGGTTGDAVTAGLYLVPDRVRALTPPASCGRLRDFLAWLAARGEPIFAEEIPAVIDVDRAADVALAETMAAERRP